MSKTETNKVDWNITSYVSVSHVKTEWIVAKDRYTIWRHGRYQRQHLERATPLNCLYLANQYKNFQEDGCRTRVATIIAKQSYNLLIERGDYLIYSDVKILACMLAYWFV